MGDQLDPRALRKANPRHIAPRRSPDVEAVEDAGDFVPESISQMDRAALVKRVLDHMNANGVVDVSELETQLAVLGLMPPSTELEDITDDLELPANLQPSVTRSWFMLGEGMFKSGRIMRPKIKAKPHPYYTQSIAAQLDSAAINLSTSTPQAQHKRKAALYLVFWTSTARSAKQTSAGTERTITWSAVYNPPNRQLRNNTVLAGFSTQYLLYQVSGTVNVSQQLAGDIVVLLPDVDLPQWWELNLVVSVPGGAATTICDAVMMLEVD